MLYSEIEEAKEKWQKEWEDYTNNKTVLPKRERQAEITNRHKPHWRQDTGKRGLTSIDLRFWNRQKGRP